MLNCENCGREISSPTNESDKEFNDTFPDSDPDDVVVLCTTCYNEALDQLKNLTEKRELNEWLF